MTEPTGATRHGDDPQPPGSELAAGEAERFVATAVADAAIAAAGRERWLRRQADETDTFIGVLNSLAERGEVVALDLTGERRVVGTIELVGTDVVGVRSTAGTQVLTATRAVGSIRVVNGDHRPGALSGDRLVVGGTTLEGCLRNLGEHRVRLTVRAAGSTPTTGVVQSCGADIVTLLGDGGLGHVIVPLGNITDVTVEDRVL